MYQIAQGLAMPKKKLTQKFIDSVTVKKPTTFTDTSLTGFQLTVSVVGSKTYYYKFFQDGRQIKKNLGKHPSTSLKDAKSNYIQLYDEITRGVNQSQKRMSLRAFVDEHYARHLESKNKSAKDSLQTLETHFLSWLGEKPIEDITVLDVATWRDKRLANGISPNTVKRNLTELKSMFNYLTSELGFLKENPIANLKNPKEVAVEEKLYLTKNEYQNILEAIEKYKQAGAIYAGLDFKASKEISWLGLNVYDYVLEKTGLNIRPHVFPFYLPYALEIALYTGMRKSEIFGLKWNNIDFEKGLVELKASQTKASRSRKIPISPQLLDNLFLYARFSKVADPDSFVFPVVDSKKAMATFQSKTGLKEKIGWHHYRHNFASSLVLKSVPLPVVMSLMGHSKLETTQRYLSVRTEDLADAVAVLDNVIPNINS
jgi:integrase